jgi:tetratricopeptide (TPR) repeat protein
VTFEDALAQAMARPHDEQGLEQLASLALRSATEERALPLLKEAARSRRSARLLQWEALLERALDRHDEALVAFEAAAELAPYDAGIAHGLARTAFEAGIPAEAKYEHALRLAPGDGEVLLGLTAARLAAGHGEQAEQELAQILRRHSTWIAGHMQLAQLRSMLGRSDDVAHSLEAALGESPGSLPLWSALFDLHIKREAFGDLDAAVARARGCGLGDELLFRYAAIAAAELGRTDEADRLFTRWSDGTESVWRIRHLLRSGRTDQALRVIDAGLGGERANEIWPYASIAWRLAGDPHSEWLEGAGKLVSVIDLTASLPPLERLGDVLRAIHVSKGEYLDQSVRGGTQTDGPLFSRTEPEIRTLREAVVRAVGDYVAQLPPLDDRHPLLGGRRDRPVRFAGSWSVRLSGAGYHASHVHPQGWISSALYVSLPETMSEPDPHAGWLTLGQPPAGLTSSSLEPRHIEPKSGRLVLFPSWMWHGTVPFAAGERLTVAFDVAPPRGP